MVDDQARGPDAGAGPPAPQRMPVRRIVTILLPLVVLGVAYGLLQGGKDAGSAPPRPAPSGIHLTGLRETWDEAQQRWVCEPRGVRRSGAAPPPDAAAERPA